MNTYFVSTPETRFGFYSAETEEGAIDAAAGGDEFGCDGVRAVKVCDAGLPGLRLCDDDVQRVYALHQDLLDNVGATADDVAADMVLVACGRRSEVRTRCLDGADVVAEWEEYVSDVVLHAPDQDEMAREHGECVVVADDGNAEVVMDETDLEAAAKEYVAGGDYMGPGHVQVWAWRRWTLGEIVVDGDRTCYLVEIPADVPACSADEHEWVAPYEVVGGLKENPGVWGKGGGLIMHRVCAHCGCLQTHDTWATGPGGEQGLSVTTYDGGDHQYREAWEAWRAESDA